MDKGGDVAAAFDRAAPRRDSPSSKQADRQSADPKKPDHAAEPQEPKPAPQQPSEVSRLRTLLSQRDLELRDRHAWLATAERSLASAREAHGAEQARLRSEADQAREVATKLGEELARLRERAATDARMVAGLFDRLRAARDLAKGLPDNWREALESAAEARELVSELEGRARVREEEAGRERGRREAAERELAEARKAAAEWKARWEAAGLQAEKEARAQAEKLAEAAAALRRLPPTPAPAHEPAEFDPTDWLSALSLGGIPAEPPAAKPSRSVRGALRAEEEEDPQLAVLFALAHPAPGALVPSREALAGAILDRARAEVASGKAWIERLGNSRLGSRAAEAGVAMPRPSAVAREPAVNAREEAPSRTEEALKRELARANWALHSLRERAAARAGQLEEELATVRAERDEARARAEAGEGEASRAAEREGEMEGRVRALRAENEELRGKVEEARGRIGEARGAIAALADTLRRRNVELEAARTQAVEMRGRAQVAEAAAAEAVQARAHAEEEAGALREQKDKSEQERKLWMDIAQDQEGHTGVLRAEIRKLEGRLHLRDGQRVEQEVLMRRVVELDARLDESERARRRSEMVARQLQKTTFRLRAERDELVAKSGPVSAPLPELARPVEPTVRRVEHEEQLANSPAPEVAAQPAEQTVKPAAEPSIEVQPRQAAEAVEDVPVVQVRRAAPEQETAETKPLSPEDNHLYAGRRSKQDSLFEQLLTAERDVGTRESMFRGSEVYDQVVAGLQARWSGFVNSILPQTEAKAEASGEQAVEAVAAEAVAAEAAVEQPPATVETAAPALEAAAAEPIKAPEAVNVAQAPEVEATTVADAAAEQDEPQPGFFTRLARMFGPAQDLSADISAEQTATTPQVAREAIAATLAMEEMRLREEAVDFGRRRQVIEAKSEAKLRPRINAVADENRRLWKTLTAAAVIGRHSRFWKLHVEPRVPPGMAPIVSAAAALRAEVPYKMTAAEELAKVEADNKWLREAVESIELRNGVGQVVSAEPVAPKKTLQLDFVKHKVAAVTRTVPAKLSEDRKFDFVKHRIDLRSREETTAAEPRTDAEVTGTIETAMDRMLDTEIRAEAATRRGKGGEKKVDASNDVLLNDHAFEALLPTAAAKDEPIRIAETEKREPAQPTTRTGRRIRIPMIYKPFGAAGASPLAPALSRELRSPASEAASAANQPVGHQDKMSASASSRASASSSRCTSRRSSMSRSSVRASDLANQLLQSDGIAADSTMGAALVPILRQIAGSPPPSHVQASEDLAASENIELLRDRMEAARSRVTDAARFIARRRRDAAQLSEVVRSYTKIWDDVEAERRQIRNDIANSTLEMVESQMLQFGSGTSSVSSVASSVGSNADRERRLAELDDIEKQAASLRAVAHRVLRAVEEELVDWTSFQTDADAALARETVTLGAAVRTELARLNQSSETMRIMIPEVDHLPRRLELSNAVAANEARARVLRGYLDEIENAAASRPGSPKSISGDSFTDLESDLADSFENVAAGQSAIVGSEGDEADESRSFFMLRSSLSSRMPSHGSSQGI